MTPRRWQRIKAVLERRQPDLTVLMDRVHKPHNFSAIVRTCDAVGIYRAHALPAEPGGWRLSAGIAQGAQKWVKLTRHRRFEDAERRLREEGLTTYAAHLSDSAVDFRSVDFTRPCAVILGTEKCGVGEEAAAAADAHIHIPMLGMVASLNVSVACALILFEAQRQRTEAGLYDRRRLDDATFHRTLFEWAYPREAAQCRRHGWPYPAVDETDGRILGRLPGQAGQCQESGD